MTAEREAHRHTIGSDDASRIRLAVAMPRYQVAASALT
jgi:hypothetical protein